jgi:uncharacterized protein (DUF2237 family)
MKNVNVFGEPLMICSAQPETGFFRDGCCNTDASDYGVHTVCAIMTDDFLAFSKAEGNDLSTPLPQYDFPGLKAGDKWCLCAQRWLDAFQNNCAPLVFLEATNEKTLELIPLETLIQFAYKPQLV